MTGIELVKAVSAEVREALREVRLPEEYHQEPTANVKVNVFENYLPIDLFEETTYYPCVLVELTEIRDNLREGTTATIILTVGTFAKEHDGWIDNFYIAEKIRSWLLKKRVLAKKFRLEEEIIWRAAENQPTPFFFTYGEMTYSMYLTQEEI